MPSAFLNYAPAKSCGGLFLRRDRDIRHLFVSVLVPPPAAPRQFLGRARSALAGHRAGVVRSHSLSPRQTASIDANAAADSGQVLTNVRVLQANWDRIINARAILQGLALAALCIVLMI